MGDRLALRIAGVFSLLSVAVLLAAIVLGISAGRAPGPIDFSQSVVLQQLYRAREEVVLISLLALIAPVLALPAGVGWHLLLRHLGGHVTLGVVLWYFGTLLVIWQDAAEYTLVRYLPAAYVPNAELPLSTGLIAAGSILGKLIETITMVGDLISFGGVILVAAAVWQMGGRWRILSGLGVLSAVMVMASFLGTSLEPIRLPGLILFMAWMAGMGAAMLRAKILQG